MSIQRWFAALVVASVSLAAGCSAELASSAEAESATDSIAAEAPNFISLPSVVHSDSTAPSAGTVVPSTSVSVASSVSPTPLEPPASVEPITSVDPTNTLAPSPVAYDAIRSAVTKLVEGNLAVSVSVWRDGNAAFSFAAGTRNDGRAVATNTPFVIASVSKLITALSVARLAQQGFVDLSGPVPWDDMGLARDRAWDNVTVRELLSHNSGMPVAQKTWLDDPAPCTVPLGDAMSAPPASTRGTWRYSNGNYCALGLLVEHVTGLDLDQAAYELVFNPAGVVGPYVSTDGERTTSAPYPKGVARLERLGGAGMWLASSGSIAAMLAAVTDADLITLEWPGIIIDQYGWGHTGSIDGAEACAWIVADPSSESGRTVLVAIVSGTEPNTGGEVCDLLLPALAIDLSLTVSPPGKPLRTPL